MLNNCLTLQPFNASGPQTAVFISSIHTVLYHILKHMRVRDLAVGVNMRH